MQSKAKKEENKWVIDKNKNSKWAQNILKKIWDKLDAKKGCI